jgi:hypothetical protein
MGVDMSWELQLPKPANPFDYRAIADVLLTIEYTALSSSDYRQKIIKQLNPIINAERLFSFREQFSDAWYSLNNPDTVGEPDQQMIAEFSTVREDFPSHLQDLEIRDITLLVSRPPEFKEELNIKLIFNSKGTNSWTGGDSQTFNGIASTRRHAEQWREMRGKSVVGNWKLHLPDNSSVINWFKDGKIEDLILVVTFSGTTRSWD